MIQLSDFMDATPHGTFISMINDTKTQVLFYLSWPYHSDNKKEIFK